MIEQYLDAKIDDVNKIALLRANAIGDLVFSLPALDALRAAYPRAEITLLARPWHVNFFRDRPAPVNRVVAIPPFRGVYDVAKRDEDPAELDRFFDEMAAECFDVAIQLHGGGQNSNRFVNRLGARLTVGMRAPGTLPLDRWVPFYHYQHEIHRFLEVVSLVGAPPVTLQPRLEVLDSDLVEARQAVPADGAPLVVIHPGAGDGRRHWPPDKFASVADALADAGARVAVSGAAWERPLVDGVIERMRAPAIDLRGRVSLRGLLGVLSRARLVVGNDSGPLHLAWAVGTATVGIYWCGNVINAGHLTRTHHRLAISWQIHCPVCGNDTTKQECPHHESFVADVPVDEVQALAMDLFTASG
jgi:ADP-heptose:LPS heptosyltransferase